jgi:hypothetical protein
MTQDATSDASPAPHAEMPWLVIAAIAQCHQEASSSCLHQLEPLLQQVVNQMQVRCWGCRQAER